MKSFVAWPSMLRVAILVASMSVPDHSWGQAPSIGPPGLFPELRAMLGETTGDPLLDEWQRRFPMALAGIERCLPEAPAVRQEPDHLYPATHQGTWEELMIPGLFGHTAVYDPVRHRVVVFGGVASGWYRNNVWVLSLSEDTPTWNQLVSMGGPPGGRFRPTAIYDPVRDRIIVFGGFGQGRIGGYLNDVWALSLSTDVPTWNELAPSGTSPSVRNRHQAIYDPIGDRMVVFGGANDGIDMNDVWALTLSETLAWNELMPLGEVPSARHGHAAIYDPIRERMVVFGGSSSEQELNDVWALNFSDTPTWDRLNSLGQPPSGRSYDIAIHDSVRDRMVLFGGYFQMYNYLNDVWALTLSEVPTWTELTPGETRPVGRVDAAAIYDPLRDRMLVFGGLALSGILHDLWSLALSSESSWTELTPGGDRPERQHQVASYDPVRNRMLVLGGNTVWELALSGTPKWSVVTASGTPPSPREWQTVVYDPLRDRMVMFGGVSTPKGDIRYNDVWTLALSGDPTWSEMPAMGNPPSARSAHTAIYDPVRDAMVVFGGFSYDGVPSVHNDVWTLTLSSTPTWSELMPVGSLPNARVSHSATYDPLGDCMIVFGGQQDSVPSLMNDVWRLTLGSIPTWEKLTPDGSSPSRRAGHTMIRDPARDRVIVFGGSDGPRRNDVWSLTLSGIPTWNELTPNGIPPIGRDLHMAIYEPVHDRMVVFGGQIGSGFGTELWALTWGGPVTVQPPPVAILPSLLFAWPNPAKGRIMLRFQNPQRQLISIQVHDVSGRRVRTLAHASFDAGVHDLVWDTNDVNRRPVTPGVYFCTATVGTVRLRRSLVVVH